MKTKQHDFDKTNTQGDQASETKALGYLCTLSSKAGFSTSILNKIIFKIKCKNLELCLS